MAEIIRLRKSLTADLSVPIWPAGVQLAPLATAQPRALHGLLVAAYENGFGQVADFDTWWTNLTADGEFDPGLMLVAVADDRPVGLAQSWTSGFLKDIVVDASQRGRGLGEALLWQTFALFKARGTTQVDLKVHADNGAARRLYARTGMIEVPL